MADRTGNGESSGLRQILLPLALAQFICSFAGSNMNVMITDISTDLDTTLALFGGIGLGAAMLLPSKRERRPSAP